MRKPATIHLKADSDETGAFEIAFATFNTIDLQKDVTRPGAMPEGKEVALIGSHLWDLPDNRRGKGVIRNTKAQAVLDGHFFMNTTQGRNEYETVKAMGGIQEYSYGYEPLKKSNGEFKGEQVRFLEEVDVYEVSTVLLGAAGRGRTGTLSLKGEDGGVPWLVRRRQLAKEFGMPPWEIDDLDLSEITEMEKDLAEDKPKLHVVPGLPVTGSEDAQGAKELPVTGNSEGAAKSLYGSYESLSERIRHEVMEVMSPYGESYGMYCWMVGTFPEHAVVCASTREGDAYWDVPYTVDADGNVSIGELTRVEQTYAPIEDLPKRLVRALSLKQYLERLADGENAEALLAEALTEKRFIVDPANPGLTLIDHTAEALAAVGGVVSRYTALAADVLSGEAKAGRRLSTARTQRLRSFYDSLATQLPELERLLQEVEDQPADTAEDDADASKAVDGDQANAKAPDVRARTETDRLRFETDEILRRVRLGVAS